MLGTSTMAGQVIVCYSYREGEDRTGSYLFETANSITVLFFVSGIL